MNLKEILEKEFDSKVDETIEFSNRKNYIVHDYDRIYFFLNENIITNIYSNNRRTYINCPINDIYWLIHCIKKETYDYNISDMYLNKALKREFLINKILNDI